MIVGLIYIYIVICLAMVFFDIFFIAIISLRKKRSVRAYDALTEDALNALVKLDEDGELDGEYVAELMKKLQDPVALQCMESVIDDLAAKISEGSLILPAPPPEGEKKGESVKPFSQKKCARLFDEYCAAIAKPIVELHSCYRRKEIEIYSYFIHFLRKYHFLALHCSVEVISGFKDAIENGSPRICENILLTVYDLADPELSLQMLLLFDKSEKYLNSKIISDGLLDYNGDTAEFNAMLLERLGDFSVPMQTSILNYLRFSSSEYCEKIFRILLDESSDDEVKFSCMRYFGKHRYFPAYPLLAEYAKGNLAQRKEFCIVAVTVLRNYPCAETVEILKKQVYSQNWNIRYNAAESLDFIGVTYEDVMDILDSDDRYTREMMQYRFDERYAKKKEEVFL